MDVVSVLCIAWGVMTVALLLLQLYFGGYLEGTHLRGSAYVASYVTFIFIGIFVLAVFAIQRNRYAALYRFEKDQVYCENLRTSPRPLQGARGLRWRGYAIEPVENPLRSIVKRVSWSDVKVVSTIGELRVLLLRGKRGVLMRVYCPDDKIFEKARAFAKCAVGSL
jgi:hypothetical protein